MARPGVAPDALLREQDRAGAVEAHRDRGGDHQRPRDEQQAERVDHDRFSGTGLAGDHGQAVAEVGVDVLKVMLARALDDDPLARG